MALINDLGTIDKELQHLENIAIMITNNCNLNCYHCFRYENLGNEIIDIKKVTKIAKIISKTPIKKLRLTGGEPFLVEGIDEFIRAFSEQGIDTSIVTNGTLISKDVMELLKYNGLNELWFSVHSNTETTHDSLVGKKGSLKRLRKAIILSIKTEIRTNVYYPISKKNINDVDVTLGWLDKIGINRVKILRITPIGKASIQNNFEHLSIT